MYSTAESGLGAFVAHEVVERYVESGEVVALWGTLEHVAVSQCCQGEAHRAVFGVGSSPALIVVLGVNGIFGRNVTVSSRPTAWGSPSAVIGWERLVGCGLRRRCCGVGSGGVGVVVEETTTTVVMATRRL